MDTILNSHLNKKIALEDHNTINLFLMLLDDPKMKNFSLNHIVQFMTIQIEDLDRQYEPLMSSFHEKFRK
jgi:FtsZ-binding cell division protein ZapB